MLGAVIGTRPELLASIYKDISPVLISRFGDREENVRLEVWATYVTLLKQTSVYGGVPQVKDDLSPRGKRKRDTEEVMDIEETAYTLLKAQVPSLSKALLNQIKSPKASPVVLQAGFSLLNALLSVLPGSLTPQIPQIITIAKTVLSQPLSTSTSALHLVTLTFLALLFSTHSPSSFAPSLPTITPALLESVGERHPRIASEAFRVFSSLLTSLSPINGPAEWVEQLYQQALSRLRNHDTDAEVRAAAEDCIGDLWIAAPGTMKTHDRKEWEYICRSSGKTDGAVKVVAKVAKEAPVGDDWVNGCVQWVMGLLQKSGRQGKVEAFGALEVLLKRFIHVIPMFFNH